MFVGLTPARGEKNNGAKVRSPESTADGAGSSPVYSIAAAVMIVAVIVYFADDVRTAYHLALTVLALVTLATAARQIIGEL